MNSLFPEINCLLQEIPCLAKLCFPLNETKLREIKCFILPNLRNKQTVIRHLSFRRLKKDIFSKEELFFLLFVLQWFLPELRFLFVSRNGSKRTGAEKQTDRGRESSGNGHRQGCGHGHG
jgi:hypothetical protein